MKERKTAFGRAVFSVPNLREEMIREIAAETHLSRMTIYGWASTGRVPAKLYREKILEVMNREKYAQFTGPRTESDVWPGIENEPERP